MALNFIYYTERPGSGPNRTRTLAFEFEPNLKNFNLTEPDHQNFHKVEPEHLPKMSRTLIVSKKTLREFQTNFLRVPQKTHVRFWCCTRFPMLLTILLKKYLKIRQFLAKNSIFFLCSGDSPAIHIIACFICYFTQIPKMKIFREKFASFVKISVKFQILNSFSSVLKKNPKIQGKFFSRQPNKGTLKVMLVPLNKKTSPEIIVMGS